MKEITRCMLFLIKNGWLKNDPEGDYVSFYKDDMLGVYIDKDEILLVSDMGDIAWTPVNYYALIGLLLEYRQIHTGYLSVKKEDEERENIDFANKIQNDLDEIWNKS